MMECSIFLRHVCGYDEENPLNKAPLRTVTGRWNDPRFRVQGRERVRSLGFGVGGLRFGARGP